MSSPASNNNKKIKNKKYPPNYNCGCSCEVCHCGPNCQCTETLCRCEASSVINSLTKGPSRSRSTSPVPRPLHSTTQQGSSCCASRSKQNNKNNTHANTSNNSTNGLHVDDDESDDNEENEMNITRATAASTETTIRESSSSTDTSIMMEVDIEIRGMTCSMCTRSIESALRRLDGVTKATVSLALHSAHVEYDLVKVHYEDLVDVIEDVGYDVMRHPDLSPAPTTVATSIVEFTVSGMTCSMCTQSIQRALEAVEGVEHVSVMLSTNQAKVEFDGSVTDVETLKQAIEDVGYDVVDIEAVLDRNDLADSTMIDEHQNQANTAMTSDRLDRLLQQQQGEVDSRKRAFIWSLVGTVPILVITMILPHFSSFIVEQWLKQHVAIFKSSFVLEALILWALATPIQFGCGYPFYKSTYYGLRQGIMGMDTLVAVGTSASYGYAVWATLVGEMEYHFFETSAVLVCFVLLGKWMQSMAVRRTSQALTHLLQLQPKTAIKVIAPAIGKSSGKKWNPLHNDPYSEEVVPIAAVKPGDYVKVLKGSSIPADGVIRFGEMTVDESMITGESLPVLKTTNAVVLGGTICAEAGQEAGACFVQVTGVGANTALSQILQLVQDAQNRQVPIQNLADTISGIFVPTVVVISICTYMIWYALIQSGVVPPSMLPEGESPATFSLLFGIACLVISCPCSLGLATPTAIMVGTGVGAKHGVLMKGGETLELASKVNAIVFDKTGTLTKGKPAITDFCILIEDHIFWKEILDRDVIRIINEKTGLPMNTMEECLLWLLGSLERNSEHLLAAAIVQYAESKLDIISGESVAANQSFAQPSNFVALTGRGASGRILSNIEVSVGNRAFCEVQGYDIGHEVESSMRRLEREGKTAIIAAINSTVVLVMGVADELKPDASATIVYLKERMALDVWMVTGDNRRTAKAIARQLRLPSDRIIAEALPVAKVEKVQELQAEGLVVAMVGDGVNDSPALVQADVGLSMGTGAEIAAEASDMVLVRGDVKDVCTALNLSRVIFRRIQLNLLWSLLYNCLGIPIAAGVFYPIFHTRLPPTFAALAMALSSISVVASSLALRLYRPPDVESIMDGRSSSSSSDTSSTSRGRQRGRGLGNRPSVRERAERRRREARNARNDDVTHDQASLTEPLLPDIRTTEVTSNLSRLEEGMIDDDE